MHILLLQRQSGNVSMTIYRNTMNVHDLKVCFNQILDDLIYLKQGDGIPPLKTAVLANDAYVTLMYL